MSIPTQPDQIAEHGGSPTELSGIRTVTISSSSKFYDSAKALAIELSGAGIEVFTPRFEYDEGVVSVSPMEKARLTHEFLDKIRRSDAVYVIAREGYTGRSVCIEIGFARGLDKVVILSEPPAEDAVSALAHAIIPMQKFTSALKA